MSTEEGGEPVGPSPLGAPGQDRRPILDLFFLAPQALRHRPQSTGVCTANVLVKNRKFRLKIAKASKLRSSNGASAAIDFIRTK
jgi:hypothetical protein